MSRIILHVDLNKFFVRCEELKNPYLIGKPVVVGGDGRKGIVQEQGFAHRRCGRRIVFKHHLSFRLPQRGAEHHFSGICHGLSHPLRPEADAQRSRHAPVASGGGVGVHQREDLPSLLQDCLRSYSFGVEARPGYFKFFSHDH